MYQYVSAGITRSSVECIHAGPGREISPSRWQLGSNEPLSCVSEMNRIRGEEATVNPGMAPEGNENLQVARAVSILARKRFRPALFGVTECESRVRFSANGNSGRKPNAGVRTSNTLNSLVGSPLVIRAVPYSHFSRNIASPSPPSCA